MKKICVWGAGWSGLTAALEASESNECEVHLFEAKHHLGGKVCGTVSEKEKISTHAIRLISEYYPAFADVCSRIPTEENKTLLNRWSPVHFFNFTSTEKNKTHFITRRLNKEKLGSLQLLWAALFTFKLKIKDFFLIGKAIKKFRSFSESDILQLEENKISVATYLEDYNLSENAKEFLFTYLGITVAARPTSMASMSMDLMSKMFIGTHRSKHLMTEDFKNYRSWVIDGPLGDRLIPPFEEELKKRGVHIHLNSPVASFEKDENQNGIAVLKNGEKINADAHIIALNNKALEKLNLGRKGKPLNNEWSVGAIYPIKTIPDEFKDIKSRTVTAVMDSPWAIVFVIWSKNDGFWSNEVEFPEGYDYFIEIVTSRIDYKGNNNKTFFECNPEEASKEILSQIGLAQQSVETIYKDVVFSENLSYVQNPEDDNLSLFSQKNEDGFCWKLYAPIYTSSGETPPLAPITTFKNTYLCGEAIQIEYPYIKTPTLELCSETSKYAIQKVFDDLKIDQKVYQEYPSRFEKRQY